MNTNTATTKAIHVVTTRYEGDPPFPEAEHYPAYIAAALAASYPGFAVEVSAGLRTQIRIDGADLDGRDLEHEIRTMVQVDLWDAFCAEGYKAYSARSAVELCAEVAALVGDDGTGDLRVCVEHALLDDPHVTAAEIAEGIREARRDAATERERDGAH